MISSEEKANLIVGYKQVCKSIKNKTCKKIFIADDCSANMFENIAALSDGIEVVHIDTMRALGELCGIDVSASCAAVTF
ncbi:MAG: ribosomal L7Ae/L30e/S12e/Gadd45 family protein [Firmicutes bacterium]|nr:ribosomal L7Ae/L30e/S12e/Gadd45 family protein [Bacillota bacterium]